LGLSIRLSKKFKICYRKSTCDIDFLVDALRRAHTLINNISVTISLQAWPAYDPRITAYRQQASEWKAAIDGRRRLSRAFQKVLYITTCSSIIELAEPSTIYSSRGPGRSCDSTSIRILRVPSAGYKTVDCHWHWRRIIARVRTDCPECMLHPEGL
jgi:hypothetical protein